jgi:hypothetical protein
LQKKKKRKEQRIKENSGHIHFSADNEKHIMVATRLAEIVKTF